MPRSAASRATPAPVMPPPITSTSNGVATSAPISPRVAVDTIRSSMVSAGVNVIAP